MNKDILKDVAIVLLCVAIFGGVSFTMGIINESNHERGDAQEAIDD